MSGADTNTDSDSDYYTHTSACVRRAMYTWGRYLSGELYSLRSLVNRAGYGLPGAGVM